MSGKGLGTETKKGLSYQQYPKRIYNHVKQKLGTKIFDRYLKQAKTKLDGEKISIK